MCAPFPNISSNVAGPARVTQELAAHILWPQRQPRALLSGRERSLKERSASSRRSCFLAPRRYPVLSQVAAAAS